MAIEILDGKGRGHVAGVNSRNRALSSAEVNTASHYRAIDGKTFNFVSEDDDAAAGDFVLYLKNTDTDRLLVIDIARVCSENAATFKFWKVTGTATGGTAITPLNTNFGSGVAASVTALGNSAIGGLSTSGSMLAPARVPANSSYDIPFDDTVILGTGDAMAVEYDTGTTGDCEVLVRFYVRKPEDVT